MARAKTEFHSPKQEKRNSTVQSTVKFDENESYSSELPD